MKMLTTTFFLLLISCTILFAQYKEGYLITNSNDTIKGYIDFEGAMKNSGSCSFKTNFENSIKVYSPGDIKAFRFIDSKYFISSEIMINDKPQKVFLEWLIKGKASILSYSSSGLQERYFILIENDSLYELKNTSQIKEIKDYKYIMQKKEYIGALKSYFNDCPSIFNQINTLPYSSKALVRISKKYHEITCGNDGCTIFEDKNRKANFALGFSFSSLNSQFRIDNNPLEYANPAKSFGYGLLLNIYNLPLLSPGFSFHTKLSYFTTMYTYDSKAYLLRDDNRLCNINYLKIPMMLRYKFLTKNFSPYVSLGITSNIRFSHEFYSSYILNYVTKHFDYNLGLRYFQLGFTSGIGFEYLTSSNLGISFEIDYELAPRFFGTYPVDKTMNKNLIITGGVFYKLKKSR